MFHLTAAEFEALEFLARYEAFGDPCSLTKIDRFSTPRAKSNAEVETTLWRMGLIEVDDYGTLVLDALGRPMQVIKENLFWITTSKGLSVLSSIDAETDCSHWNME